MRLLFAAYRPFSLSIASSSSFILSGWYILGFLVGTIFLFDTAARYREAKEYERTRSPRLKTKLTQSWCGRGVLTMVDVGYKDPKPFWIFPAGFPKCFLQWRFWKSVLGIKH